MKPIISVRDLSKKFRIQANRKPDHGSLREDIYTLVNNFKIRKQRKQQPEEFWALKNINFEVEAGEVVGIIGANGAGKSTLLKILSRITRPTTGEVILKGRVGSLLEVGAGFHQELTGRENIFMNGAVLGMKQSEIRAKFDEIVDFAEVEQFIDTPVKHYSSGMYVRLAFAVAAHLEPEILIVDEVLAVGDVMFQKKCLGKMGDVARSGRTILFVSHNLPAVRNLCDRAILLNKGQIEREGKTNDVIHFYLSQNSQPTGAKIWSNSPRPKNHSIQVNSIFLKNSSCDNIPIINISEDAFIEINYEVVKENSQAGFAIDLLTNEEECVFSSLSNLEANFYGKDLSCGLYTTRCYLYGNLLNAGKYRVMLSFFSRHWSDRVTIRDALVFDAIDDGVLKGDYPGSYAGCIRPKLQWETDLQQSRYQPDLYPPDL